MKKTFSVWLITLLIFLTSPLLANEKINVHYEKKFRVNFALQTGTLDPQKTSMTADHMLRQHFFDPLFTIRNGEIVPILVEDYEWQTPTRWLFNLKKGVRFHDGSELTTKDVLATFVRANRHQNDAYNNIKGYVVSVLDDYRFLIDTQTPNSELLWDLEDIVIIHHSAEMAEPAGFDNGKFLLGTGPYQLVSRKGFDQFTLRAFPDYHRGAAYIKNVEITVEADSKKRADNLINGDADLVGRIAGNDLQRLVDADQHNVIHKAEHGVFMLVPDQYRDQSPDVRDHHGNPLAKNPLKDLRVRQAISKSLDRDKLIPVFMQQHAAARSSGQLVNPSVVTASSSLLPEPQDLLAARKLLKEAGYPDGFQLTLTDKEARRPVLEMMADMLGQAGIKTTVRVLPVSEYFKGVGRYAFSMPHYSYSTDGNLANLLTQILHSDATTNGGRYHNAAFERELGDALKQTSDVLKIRGLRKAHEMAVKDLAVIPIMFSVGVWAIRPDMGFKPTDQNYTEAYYVGPYKK